MKTYDLSKMKVVRAVATPQLSLKGDIVQIAVIVTSAIVAGREDPDTKRPVYSCKVTDLTDGVEKAMVTPAIIRSELERTYPMNETTGTWGYVGKAFAMNKGAKASGKRYHAWDIVELDVSQAEVHDAQAE